MIRMDLEGIDKIHQRVNQIRVWYDDGPIVKAPIRAAARVIAAAQRQRAPIRPKTDLKRRAIRKVKVDGLWLRPQGPQELIKPGQLKRAIKYSVRTRKGELKAKVGMNVGMRKYDKRRAPHGHLVALGTKKRRTSTGANRGVMPQNTFVRDATLSVSSAALTAMEQGIKKEFEKSIARLR